MQNPLLSEFCPPPEELRGGTKNFSGASRPICPPPELNPVSATVYIYIYYIYYIYTYEYIIHIYTGWPIKIVLNFQFFSHFFLGLGYITDFSCSHIFDRPTKDLLETVGRSLIFGPWDPWEPLKDFSWFHGFSSIFFFFQKYFGEL